MKGENLKEKCSSWTNITRRRALKGFSSAVLGGTVLTVTSQNTEAGNTDPHTWREHGEYDTQYPAGTTHHVCSVLKLVSTRHVPGDETTDEHWVHSFQVSNQVAAVETDSGDPIDNLRSQGVRIKNNDSENVPVLVSKNEKNNSMAPESDNPNHTSEFVGILTGAASVAATWAGSLLGGFVLGGSALSSALGQFVYSLKMPDDYEEYVWDGGYSGIKKGANQFVFDVHNYRTSTTSTPPVQISSHASQAYTGWNLHFAEDTVYISSLSEDTKESPQEPRGPMGDPRQMSKSEKEKYGIQKVKQSELETANNKQQVQTSDREWVYVAENPPVTVTPMSREESKELWE